MDDLLELCKNALRIYIYGAGKNAENIYLWFQRNDVDFTAYIVTSMEQNPEYLHGKAVITIDSWIEKPGDLVISSMSPKTNGYFRVFETLERRGIKNAFFFSEDELNELKIQETKIASKTEEMHDIMDHGLYRYLETVSVEKNHYIFAQERGGDDSYRWRLSEYYIKKLDGQKLCDFFRNSTALDEYQAVYGLYNTLNVLTKKSSEKKTCKIYMAASLLDEWVLKNGVDPWIEPVQVGAALSSQKVYHIQDDNGDNISLRNKNWSEGTVIYWMWKNSHKTDYIGLCHYRRRLVLSEMQIASLDIRGIDVVVTSPSFVFDSTLDFLMMHTPQTDFLQLGKKISEICPQYIDAYETFLKARFYPPCNLFLMRWEIFKDYGDMAMPVCLAIDEYYYSLGYRRRDRYMGYLLEVLLGVYIIKNKDKIKVAYTDMQFIEKEK